MPKVSVIMSAYNYEEFIGYAIKSVLNQTYKNFELIITDDASTDNTLQVIRSFKDPRIKIFTFTTNRGESIAQNNGIIHSKGDYIAILNADDEFLPSKLKKQVAFLDSHPNIAAVFTQVKVINDNGKTFTDKKNFYYSIFKQFNRSRYEWLRRFFYEGNCLCHPSIMVRRIVYNSVGLYDARFAQIPDFHLWVRICMKYDIYILPELLTKFRVGHSEKQKSGSSPDKIIRDLYEYNKVLTEYLKINNVNELLKIFPEIAKITKEIDKKFIPFYIAKLSLDNKSIVHQYFAINTLYDLLASKKMAKELEIKYDFKASDFAKLTGQSDLLYKSILLIGDLDKPNLKLKMLESKFRMVNQEKKMLNNSLRDIKRAKVFKIWQAYCKIRDKILKKNYEKKI